jgi:excinuclease ABC subunit A
LAFFSGNRQWDVRTPIPSGKIVAFGTPEAVAAEPASWTGRYLADILARHEDRRMARRRAVMA